MAVPSSSAHNVFVYGTLMADEVVNVVLERVPRSAPAVLPDYQRHSLKGRVYPAIVPAEKKKVNGKILFDLTDYELEILDTFEDVEYKRIPVELLMQDAQMQQDCSNQLKAYTYVWSDTHDIDLYGEWNYEEWRDAYMNEFVSMCSNFMSELKQSSVVSRVSTCESFFQEIESL